MCHAFSVESRRCEDLSQSMVLRDGRQLGFAEWTAGSETVVFDFHGGPGCRLSVSVDVEALSPLGVRWVTVDRPGLGLSWPKPGRTVADWADDVVELADHLGVDRFHVVGWSMGGPYAGACAALLGGRVDTMTLLSPAPVGLDQPGAPEKMGKAFAWVLARDDPWAMLDLYTKLGLEARRNPELALQVFSDGLTDAELAVFSEDDIKTEFIDTMIEATRQGAAGLVDELRVEMAPWGFDPTTITVPSTVWQGDDDSWSSPQTASTWATAIPRIVTHIVPGGGHLMSFEHTATIVSILLSAALSD